MPNKHKWAMPWNNIKQTYDTFCRNCGLLEGKAGTYCYPQNTTTTTPQ